MAMNARRRAGFTLVELMIALLAGGFAVAGVYYLNGVSSRTFSEQMRVSETQMSLRSAMEQLRREFGRAGYLHTASSRVNPDCSGTPPADGMGQVAPRLMRALDLTADGSLAAVTTLLTPASNRTRADRVDVWANFATSDAYLADPVGTTTTSIRFQTDSESFRRSFVDPNTGAIDDARFRAAFAQGRTLRVEHEGRVYFRDLTADLTARSFPPYQVDVDALPWCFEPSRWTAVAPVVHYRYGLEPDTTADLSRLRAATPSLGSSRALLVRREWRMVGGTDTVVPNSARVVLDYAVEFGVEAIVDTAAVNPTAPAAAPVWALERGAAMTARSASAPWAFRSLILTLTSRSAEADPRLPSITRAAASATVLDAPMMTFCVLNCGAAAQLNARVRTMRSEIFLQNM